MATQTEITRGAILAGAAITAAGCVTAARRIAGRDLPKEPTVPDDPKFELTVMNRMAFGPLPGDLVDLRRQGFKSYLDGQLNADSEESDTVLKFQLSRLDVMRVSAAELRDLPEGEVARQLRQATLLRMMYSKSQLRERMVDFWTNHFNILAEKGDNAYRKPTDDLLVIRKHALGKFSDLVRASAKSAAMLGYLNNDVNKKGVPNENYARELMELHTMGVHGGYTQQDIKEVARCLTGWTVEDRKILQRMAQDGREVVGTGLDKFAFRPGDHDEGVKNVLGYKIQANGSSEGDQVIDIVTRHPATAAFICGKLCRYFLGDEQHPAARLAAETFRKTDGDIKEVLRTILTEENLKSTQPLAKRPIDFVASALRTIGAESDGGRAIQEHLVKMGQPLFGWPMPDGYPDKTAAWTGSLLARWNFAWALANGQIAGTWFDEDRIKGREELLTTGTRSAPSRAPILALAGALSNPAFQWR